MNEKTQGWRKEYGTRTWRIDGVGTKARARCWANGEGVEEFGIGILATVRMNAKLDEYIFEGEHFISIPHEVLIELWQCSRSTKVRTTP